jgi:hypothetical protein
MPPPADTGSSRADRAHRDRRVANAVMLRAFAAETHSLHDLTSSSVIYGNRIHACKT